MNRQLRASFKGEPNFVSQGIWFDDVNTVESIGGGIDHFLDEMSRYLNQSQVIYLKYNPVYHGLVLSRQVNLKENVRGVGIDLPTSEDEFDLQVLKNLENLKEFKSFVSQVFSSQKYSVLCLNSDEDIKGVFLFLDKENVIEDPYIVSCLHFLSLKVSQIETKRKLKNVTIYDRNTHILNRTNLLKRLTEEVHRGRRIHWPISFAIISIDQFDRHVEDTPQGIHMLLKMLALVINKNSRVNDIFGKMGAEEFGMILPHTLAQGAICQAERLRNIVESLDFSNILPQLDQVTLSFGISEYPSISKNMDGLLISADKALSQSRGTQGNKVFLAQPPNGLIPDFIADKRPTFL